MNFFVSICNLSQWSVHHGTIYVFVISMSIVFIISIADHTRESLTDRTKLCQRRGPCYEKVIVRIFCMIEKQVGDTAVIPGTRQEVCEQRVGGGSVPTRGIERRVIYEHIYIEHASNNCVINLKFKGNYLK